MASPEVVWATNDDKILGKLDPATLSGGTYGIGSSSFKAEGGSDPLAPLVPKMAGDLTSKAAAAIES